MLKWIVFGSLVFLASVASYLFFYLGFYRPVEITRGIQPGFYRVYKSHIGPYHEINPVIEDVEKWALLQGISCQKTFGEYLDDPAAVEPARLKSRGGCIVSEPAETLPEDLSQDFVPESEYLIAYFSGSPSIGPFKVYPAVFEYASEHQISLKTEVIEVYHAKEGSFVTEFLFPIETTEQP